MAVQTDRTDADMHKLDQNVLLFVRLLRAVGLKVGPSAMLDSLRSVQLVGLHNKAYFYYALSVSLLNRPEDRVLFDQAFHLFWRNPKFMEQMRNMLLPQMKSIGGQAEKDMIRRLEDALGKSDEQDKQASEITELQIDARQTISEKEAFQTKDFQMMSAAEWAEAEKAVANLISRLPTRPARRFRPAANGQRSDLRSILRTATQNGGLLLPHYRQPVSQPRPVVVLCDISGSMESYSRMMLHFMHALTKQSPARVSSFLFGTQLTNITRMMQNRDVDDAVAAVALAAPDWAGGTRISSSLAEFNQEWARRVLGQGAVVLLMTDGLDRETNGELEVQIDRLHKSCAQLIWLNPLLRYDGFAPKSRSVQTMLAHVDRFVPVHSLRALSQLVDILSAHGQSINTVTTARSTLDWQEQARQFAAQLG